MISGSIKDLKILKYTQIHIIISAEVKTSVPILIQMIRRFYLRRMWQNSKHSPRSAWVQVLKDKMKRATPVPTEDPDKQVDLDAETEVLGDQSDGESSDGIPDNFFGVIDEPLFDGSEPPLSQPRPIMDDEVSWMIFQVYLHE